jgi:hydrogenase maturation protease
MTSSAPTAGRGRIIGLGQVNAGDDGVGLAVVEHLRARGVPEGVELAAVSEPTALVSLLETPVPVVLVDAALASPPGRVLTLTLDELAARPIRALSSHGLDVAHLVAFARLLAGDALSPRIRVVAVTIEQPVRGPIGLSAAAARAVEQAAAMALALVTTAGE